MRGFLSRLGFRLAIVGIGLGVGFMWIGWEDYTISSKTKATPATMTAAQLSKSGPPHDNAFVHITNYDVNPEYVIETKEHDSYWSNVWLQIMPAGTTAAAAGKPIVLKDGSISNEQDLDEFGKQSSFDGIVANGLISVSPPKNPSGMHFPNIDTKTAWVIEKRERPDGGSAIAWFLGGLALAGCGAIPVIRRIAAPVGPGKMGSTTIASRNKR